MNSLQIFFFKYISFLEDLIIKLNQIYNKNQSENKYYRLYRTTTFCRDYSDLKQSPYLELFLGDSPDGVVDSLLGSRHRSLVDVDQVNPVACLSCHLIATSFCYVSNNKFELPPDSNIILLC